MISYRTESIHFFVPMNPATKKALLGCQHVRQSPWRASAAATVEIWTTSRIRILSCRAGNLYSILAWGIVIPEIIKKIRSRNCCASEDQSAQNDLLNKLLSELTVERKAKQDLRDDHAGQQAEQMEETGQQDPKDSKQPKLDNYYLWTLDCRPESEGLGSFVTSLYDLL